MSSTKKNFHEYLYAFTKKEKEERFISLKIFLEEYIIPLEFLGITQI